MKKNYEICHVTNNLRMVLPIATQFGHVVTNNPLVYLRYDIIHCHALRASCLPLLLGFLAGVRVRIYHNHGLSYIGHKGLMRLILKGMERWNMFFATHIIYVSEGNLREAEKDKIIKKHVAIINNGSACGVVENPYPVRDNPEKLIFGYIGRPVKRKGFYLMLEAWEKSELAKQGHMLWIAGGHAEGENVKSFGWVENIEKFIAKCDVICLPSYHEGLPNALLEGAMACKPLIGSDIAGIRDVIVDKFNGFLFPVGDKTGLVNVLKKCVDKHDELIPMGMRGKWLVTEKYNRTDVMRDYAKFYKDIQTTAIRPWW